MNRHESFLLNKTNNKRIKVYYNLSELEELTGMCLRALKYRMLYVKHKYHDVPSLLTKKDRQWQIHYTIVNEFEPKYILKAKTETIYNQNWVSMASWNPITNYDTQYHIELVKQIKEQLPNNTILYTIESDGRNINHTHIVSNAKVEDLNNAVTSTISKYIENKREVRVQVESVRKKFATIEYLRKAPLASGVL